MASTASSPIRPALVLVVACVAQFMLLADDTIVNVALPSLAAGLQFTESSLSWVVNAYLLTFGVFLVFIADRGGHDARGRGLTIGRGAIAGAQVHVECG